MDIKKAWNNFKKDIKKEGLDLSGLCYMTAKQIANRTATILLCNAIPYEEEIERTLKSIAKVQSYDSWTDEEKARAKKRDEETIAVYEAEMKKFGTKENEAKVTSEQIVSSKAFKTFCEDAEIEDTVSTNIEMQTQYGINLHYLRITY